MNCFRFFFIGAMLAAATPSIAATAVCRDAIGHDYGERGPESDGKRVDVADSMRGVTFIFSWVKGAKSVSVTTSDTRFNRNLTNTGIVINEAPEQISFAAWDTSVVWMYSIFPKAQVALISSHGTDAESRGGGAIAVSLLATCVISE
jgi:hypothetical protein